jgi:hypothetical protein
MRVLRRLLRKYREVRPTHDRNRAARKKGGGDGETRKRERAVFMCVGVREDGFGVGCGLTG